MKCLDKRQYSRVGAWRALHRLSISRPKGQYAIRMYECGDCKRYHLTKIPPATDLAAELRRMMAMGISF